MIRLRLLAAISGVVEGVLDNKEHSKHNIKLILALILVAILVVDNITTILALSKPNVKEINPVSTWFYENNLWLLYTIIKPLIGFLLVYYMFDFSYIAWTFYLTVLILYMKAIITNVINLIWG